MSPKQERGAATADRLLDAALDVHTAAGPEGFTLAAITAASGVSQGSLYHHFGSFDGLAAALYARCMARLLDALVEALARTRTARTGVRAVVTAYLRFTADHPDAARFVHASAYAEYLRAHADRVRAAKEPRLAALAAWLRPHVAAGRVAAVPEPLVEMLLIGPAAETARRWLAGDPAIDLGVAARVLPDRVWRSLEPG